jgi:arsenite-transporting ATPase
MRILLFSGKGGVGKTSLAAATGLRLAQMRKRTLVMSVDPAHSLADSFDLASDLFQGSTGDPQPINEFLDVQEVNIQREIKRHWAVISAYITGMLRTTGMSGVEAEELAIFPGMEELSAMMYVNQYRREGRYEVLVLDCAPTAESMRFVSMPSTLAWYMKHIFPFHRTMLKAVRPIANRISPVDLPPDSYFSNVLDIFQKIDGIDTLLEDPTITSVRLVTNPEKMVLRETQRAYVYFSLHGLAVDSILVNRVLPEAACDGFFADWRLSQRKVLEEMDSYFAPLTPIRIPLLQHELLGAGRLEEVAALLYPEGGDPAAVTQLERPYQFEKIDGKYQIRLNMPFATKAEIGLFKKGDELVVEIGTLRRHIGLPTSMSALVPSKARLENKTLIVEMKEAS